MPGRKASWSEVRGLWPTPEAEKHRVQNRTDPPLKSGSVLAGAVIHLSVFIPHEPLCLGIFLTVFPHGQDVFYIISSFLRFTVMRDRSDDVNRIT